MLITDVYICQTLLLYLRSICDVMCKVCLKTKNKVKKKKARRRFQTSTDSGNDSWQEHAETLSTELLHRTSVDTHNNQDKLRLHSV